MRGCEAHSTRNVIPQESLACGTAWRGGRQGRLFSIQDRRLLLDMKRILSE